MSGPVWSAAGLTVRQAYDHIRQIGLLATIDRRTTCLSPELVRSVRDWLTWWLDDDGRTPPPADPDRVRAVVDDQRAELVKRSVEVCSEDFRAGLAWCDHALDAIAAAAEAAS